MMSKEDMRFSRQTWVGNLYQKFEAMCYEVDDLVSQEHIKNLEDHVQSVGENVMKFCSNVKDLLPSSLGVPVKFEPQSVNGVMSNIDLEGVDGEFSSVANAKQLPQQMDVIDSLKSYHSCIQVSDDLHSADKFETPSSEEPSSSSSELQLGQSDRFLINAECVFHPEEEKQSSEISDLVCSDSSSINQNSDLFTKEKQSPSDGSELTCPGSPLINLYSDSFSKNKEESSSDISELIFPDDYPCKRSMSSSHGQNQATVNEVSFDVSASALKHTTRSEFHLKEEMVQDSIDGYSLESTEMVCNNSIYKHGPASEFHLKEEVLCDSIHKFSLGSGVCLNEDMVCDSIDKSSPGPEFRVKEERVHDCLSESSFDVSNDNVPYSLLASSVTSSEAETSNVRLPSINSPLLEFSDHCETEFLCREGHTRNDKVVENRSASSFFTAFQSSEASSCILSPGEKIGDVDSGSLPSSRLLTYTEASDVSDGDNVGFKPKEMEFSVKVQLDESCVLVETDGFYTDSCALERACLRKKKIRDSFSSRKKLEREYKQLAIWYCDLDAEFEEVSGQKLAPLNDSKHLTFQDVQESEWQLL